jgi:hypothetical protein
VTKRFCKSNRIEPKIANVKSNKRKCDGKNSKQKEEKNKMPLTEEHISKSNFRLKVSRTLNKDRFMQISFNNSEQ